MNEKTNVFTLLAVVSTMQGIKAAVCDSRTLSFLWTVNVPGFIDAHMWLTVNRPRHCGACRGPVVNYRAIPKPLWKLLRPHTLRESGPPNNFFGQGMKLDLSTILCSPPTYPLKTNIYTLLSRFSGCKLASRVFWFRELFLKCVYL